MAMPLLASYYNDVRTWARKHKKVLVAAAGVAGSGLGAYYLWSSLKARVKALDEENDAQAALLRKDSEDRAEAQAQSHFESIQRISDSTTLPSVLPHLKDRLFELVNISNLTNKLVSGKEDPQALSSREKLNLWQELKVMSFARTVCAMWSVSLLDLFIRTQLNILGRHVYFDTARDMSISNAVDQCKPLSLSCQDKFIAFAGYLPKKGLDGLMRDVHAAVDAVIRIKPLKEPYKISDLREAFLKILDTFQEKQGVWVQYVLPENNLLPENLVPPSSSCAERGQLSIEALSVSADSEMLEQLILETRCVLSSDEFAAVLAAALDAVLEAVLEDLSTIYEGNLDKGIPLAKLLPPVASMGNTLTEHSNENRYIQILARLPQLRSFCAMVYTSLPGYDGAG